MRRIREPLNGNAAHASRSQRNGKPQRRSGGDADNGRLRRVLITGGAGFIGTNVAAALAADGCEIHVLDNLSRPGVDRNLRWLLSNFPGQIKLHKNDIRDAVAVAKAISRCDAVFHFAAQVAVTTSLRQPRLDFAVNAEGTLNVLEAYRRLDSPPALLFTSTNKVYGELGGLPLQREGTRYEPLDADVRRHGIGENQPLDFHSPYGCSKGVADQYVLDYARCYGLPATVFRMSCIYGPHQCGTEDQGWVAHFIRRALAGESITFYGDGCQVRDLLYVDDLVRAMRLAVQEIESVGGQAFNIGGGPRHAASLREVTEIIAAHSGGALQIESSQWRQGDQRYYVTDTRRFRKATGWEPQVDVRRGLGRLYEWMQVQRPALAAAQ